MVHSRYTLKPYLFHKTHLRNNIAGTKKSHARRFLPSGGSQTCHSSHRGGPPRVPESKRLFFWPQKCPACKNAPKLMSPINPIFYREIPNHESIGIPKTSKEANKRRSPSSPMNFFSLLQNYTWGDDILCYCLLRMKKF